MKIAILSQSYPPMVSGAAVVASELANRMAQRGHDILVLTTSDRASPYTITDTRLTVRRMRSYHNPFRVGQRFALWPHGTITASLREFHPDVIHTHDPFQFTLSALSYGRRSGVPVVITAHQLPWFLTAYLPKNVTVKKLVDRWLWAYSRWLIRRLRDVVAPTQTIASVVLAKTGLASRVISFGVESSVFHPGPLDPQTEANLRIKFGIPMSVPVLLYVGRLDLDKSVDVVIHAAARAMIDNQAHLLIIGDGTEKATLIHQCETLDISERVHFPGFVRIEEGLADIYRLGSVFITASEFETQGLVLLEAASCGLPVVAVDSTCISEIVHDGINGWLAKPGDIDGLALRIRRCLNDPSLAVRMGQAGRRMASVFDLQKSLDAYEEVYIQAFKQSGLNPSSPKTSWRDRVKHFCGSG